MTKYHVEKTGVRHTQLFNLKENPHEFIKEHHDPKVVALTGIKPTQNQLNLADNPKYAVKLKEMEALLLTEMRRLDAPYRLCNQPVDGLENPKIMEIAGKEKRLKNSR